MDQRPVLDREASRSSTGISNPGAPAKLVGCRPLPRECDIRLSLPARAENVALVRHVLGALAEAMHLPADVVEDIKLAVTEACTNVVRHAYPDVDGPLNVEVEPLTNGLSILVVDRGRGLERNPLGGGPGLGLPLIAALATQVELEESPGHGSRLRMSFGSGDRVRTA